MWLVLCLLLAATSFGGSFLDGRLLGTHRHSQPFFNVCISASLPKTEAHWNDVMSDLKQIKNRTESIHIDATLYTESDARPSCKVTAMRCFLLELRVIFQETDDTDVRQKIENLILLANNSLPSDGNVTESGCKECEELEEKNVKEFLRSFTHIVQMFINTPLQ